MCPSINVSRQRISNQNHDVNFSFNVDKSFAYEGNQEVICNKIVKV